MLLIMQYRCGSDCARAIREIAAKGLFTIQPLPGFVDERISILLNPSRWNFFNYSSPNETKRKAIALIEPSQLEIPRSTKDR